MRVYGTVTSPYVRRVRAVAHGLGLDVELVDVNGEIGQAALIAASPVWKVPIVEIGGEVLFDSRVIVEHLVTRHGFGPLRPSEPTRWAEEMNLITVIDGALDAAISLFYLVRRDGADPGLPYLRKQRDRIDSAFAWLSPKLRGGSLHPNGGFGVPELALYTTLDWMHLRGAWPVEAHPYFLGLLDTWGHLPALAATAPPRD